MNGENARVAMTVPVSTSGSIIETEVPFVVGVLADLLGDKPHPKSLAERQFTPIEGGVEGLERFIAELAPRLSLKVPLQPGGDQRTVEQVFRSLKDFEPDRVADNDPYVSTLKKIIRKLADVMDAVEDDPALGQAWKDAVRDKDKMRQLLTRLLNGDL